MMGLQGNNVHRPDLVELHGHDTKFASHMLRLGYQSISVLNDGEIAIPLPPDAAGYIIAVREGRISQVEVLAVYSDMKHEVARRLTHNEHRLRNAPDSEWVEDWVYRTIQSASDS